MARQRRRPEEFFVAVRRGHLAEVTIYEISAEELELLAQGSNDSLFLNIALSLFFGALSLFFALLTTTIGSDRLFTVFVVIVVVGFIGSIVLFVIWLRNRKSVSELVRKIKNRVAPRPDGTPTEPAPPAT